MLQVMARGVMADVVTFTTTALKLGERGNYSGGSPPKSLSELCTLQVVAYANSLDLDSLKQSYELNSEIDVNSPC